VKIFKVEGYKGNLFQFSACAIWALALAIMPHFNASAQNNDCILSREENVCLEFRSPDMFAAHYQLNPAYLDDAPDASVVVTWNGFGSYTQGFEVIEKTKYYKQCAPVSVIITNYFNWRPRDKLRFKLMGPEAMLSGLLFCNSGNIVTGINESVQLTNFTTSVPITKPGAYKLFEPLVYRMYCALASGCVETNLFISMLDIGPDTTNIYLGCGLSETILLQPNSAFSKPPYRWTDTSRPGFSTNTLNYQPYTFNPRGQCGTFVVTATMTNEPFATDSALINVRKLEAETSVVYVARSCETNCGAELRIKSNCWSDDPLNWFSQPAGIEAAGTNAYIDPSYLDAGPYSVMVTSAAAPGCQGSIALHVLDVVLPADDLYIFTANPLYRRARLSVSSESYLADGSVTWSSIPAGISGTGRVISISTTNLSDGTYTVTARSTILSNCLATMTVLVGEDFPQVDDDGDTIPDAWEQIVGLDPHVNDGWWDHDFDGLPAIHEFHASTNPFDPDSDSDQMPDGWEVFWRLNPAENDAGLDADDDGSTNYREYREITNPRQFPGILQQVSVAGSFNDWSTQSHSLIRTSSHDWVGGATLLQGLNEFKFVGNLNWDSGFNWGCDASSITLTPPLSSINLVLSGGNVAVNIQTAGLYRVHFSTNALRFDLAKVNAISNPPVHTINRYRVAGTFNNWNTASEQSALYPMANELHAGVIYVADSTSPQWKIVENESWINNRGAYPSFVPASIVDAPTVPAGADFTTTSAAPGFLLTTYDPVSGRVYMKRIDHDTDLDGIPDQMEVAYYGSNPQNQDTDGDGLLDGVEAKDAKTQLTESDTDGDGLQDGWEIENNLDPLDNGILRADEVLPGSTFASSAHQAGSIHNGTNGDPDQDGLSNENEQMMGTSAANNDTDGDGMSDGEDYDPIKASCMIRVAMDQPVALPGIHQTASDGSGQRQNHTSVPFNFNLPPEAIGVTKVQVSGYVDDGFSVDGKDVENNKHAGGFNADITGFINNRKGPATITVFDYVDLGWEDNLIKFEGTAQIEYNVPVRVSGVPREVCVGNTISISVQVSPPEAAGEISFQSGNLAIASVSGSGSGISIQGLAAGVTSVKVLYGGDVCHTYSLNVRGTKIVGPGTMCVGAQDTFVASCGVAPFQWTSSNPQIASVNNGIVTAHQIGIVNISATDATGVRDTIKVKVGSGFEDETPLCVGDERALLAKCSGSTFSEWTSSSPAVASVSPNGILTALGPGVTEVRVRNGSGAYVSGMFQVVKFTGPEDVIAECWTDGGSFNSYAHFDFDDGYGYTGWDADEAEWSYEKVWGADPADFNVETGDLYFGDGGGRYKITAHHLDYGCEAVIGVLVARPTPLMIGEVEGVSCNADIKTATFYETTNANDDVWVNLNAGLSADNAPDCLRLEKSAGTLAFEKDGQYRGKVSRKQPGWVTIESECCHDDTCEHGKVVIVAGNLKIDSNNDKQITDEDDEVEMDNPGKIIMYNGNDDDLNNIPDREQAGCVTGEKDLVPVQIHIDNYNDLDDGTEIIIEAPQGATSIKLWADPQKCQPLPHPAVFKKGVMTPPANIFIEGHESGRVIISLQVKAASSKALILDEIKKTVIDPRIIPDWNRDRKIDAEDENQINITNPFRFWINDDNDSGDISSGDCDVPGKTVQAHNNSDAPDYSNGKVDGRSDLLDFFPLWFDLESTAKLLPVNKGFTYKLSQADGALRFVYTDLKCDQAGQYQIKDGKTYGPNFRQDSYTADTIKIPASGIALPKTFLDKIVADQTKGILILEGASPSTAPLTLEIWQKNRKIYSMPSDLSISPVEDMYRNVNLRSMSTQPAPSEPTNNPDNKLNGKQFIFVHGYNVSEKSARGWGSEMFKRLQQSGSRAMFTAVTWLGNDRQVPESIPFAGGSTPDYYINVEHAFETAPLLVASVSRLPGQKFIAAHSLGNIVVSSAVKDYGLVVSTYFMLNAAVAMEAYSGNILEMAMRHPQWQGYSNHLWASEWYKLFDQTDGRNSLTWRDKFGDITNAINYYSETEDVLDNGDGQLHNPLVSRWAWFNQEIRKGTELMWIAPGNNEGGWGFNPNYYNRIDVELANAIKPSEVKTNSFFLRFDNLAIYGPEGSELAKRQEVNNRLLADAIPALSFAMGRNTSVGFGLATKNLTTFIMDDWPQPNNRWHHSDVKYIAFFFNYLIFDDLVFEGRLK
jgi:Bacterial TSP3 repeat